MAGIFNAVLTDLRSWGGARHPRIFISYRRRGEGAGYGGRVADKLVEHFGAEQCFRDVDNIESGVDFVQTIQDAVGHCEVLVAVIGPDWTTLKDDRGRRRLDDVRDFVRLEVAAALERNVRVIPVLVGGAEIPTEHELPDVLKALARRQARELSDTRWEYDVNKLAEVIESIGIKGRTRSKPRALIGLNLKLAAAGAAAAVGGVALIAALFSGAAAVSDLASSLEASSQSSFATPGAQTAVVPDAVRPQDTVRWEAPAPTNAQPQAEAFTGTVGKVDVAWQHEGVTYNATVITNGARGIAHVYYLDPLVGTQIAAEQDLELVTNADGAFYVGANPRLPGTGVPHPAYTRDIFKLARMDNGNWTISEVGESWQHFDTAVTR